MKLTQGANIKKILKTGGIFCLLSLILCTNAAKANISINKTEKGIVAAIDMAASENYDISQTGDLLNIELTQSNLQKLEELPQYIPQAVEVEKISKEGSSITLKLLQDTTVNSYSKGNKLYISFEDPRAEKIKAAEAASKPLPSIEIDYKAAGNIDRFILKFPQLPPYRINTSEQGTQLIFETPFKLISRTLKHYNKRKEITFSKNEKGQAILSFPAALKQRYEQKNNLIVDLTTNKDSNIENGQSQNLISGIEGNVSVIKTNSLSFSWNIPVSIGVFKRNGYLWIVFDHPQNFDIEKLNEEAAPLGTEVIQVPNNMAAIVRLKPQEGAKINVRREGLLWIVDLYTGHPQVERKEFPIFTQYDVINNAYLFIPGTSLNKSISFFDPEIGDIITVLTSDEVNTGLKEKYQYPDIEFMSSYNGIATIFKSDDLTTEIGNSGVSIRRDKGSLRISENLDMLKRRTKINSRNEEKDNIFAAISKELLAQPYNEAKAELENNIASVSEDKKANARNILALYYLSKGLGIEALKILEAGAKESPSIRQEEQYHKLKGIANFLQRRYQEAQEDFSYGGLADSNEANFWRIITSTAISPQKEDSKLINSYNYMIKDYPNEIKRRIALVSAQANILANDDLSLQNDIDIIRNSENQADSAALIGYFGAEKMEILGYPLNAIRGYREVSLLNSAKYSAYARRNIIKLQKRANSIKTEEAIKEYEKLRYSWGEKSFKKEILKELAAFYNSSKDYASALKTLDRLRVQSEGKEQDNVTRQMVGIFENVYLNNQDTNMSSLKSLALYEDYDWLSALSQYHQQISTKIADRLVAVDLLDRAYEILSSQYQRATLTAEERGIIGTRMALINLFQENPTEALNNLDGSENEALSPSLINHRRIIRAKALSAMGEPEAALELLRQDYSRNGLLMKAEIYWQNEQWNEAADTLKYLIEKPEENQKLSEEQQKLILDWATALKQAGRETVIVRLRNAFKPYFAGSIYESAFNVLTESLDENKIDIKEIDQAINNISAFSGFAKIYTESIKQGPMSESIK